MPISPPYLSQFDPAVSQEGTVDPLSLQAVANRLAERIFPWVTNRMSRIRFVTAISLGAVVCEPLEEKVAPDRVTPAWLVFEWYLVEALIRGSHSIQGDPDWGRGVPGFRKVRAAIESGQPLSPGLYLKAPQFAGFTGVYKRIGMGLYLVNDEVGLGPAGGRLVKAWQTDQGLPGFLEDPQKCAFRADLQKAVRDSLRKGHSDRAKSWNGWEQLARHLAPGSPGKREREVLFELLYGLDGQPNPGDPEALEMRREMIDALVEGGKAIEPGGEAHFFHDLGKRASDRLAIRLAAIEAYEAVCALLLRAFNLIQHLSAEAGDLPITAGHFGKDKDAVNAAAELPRALETLEEAFVKLGCPEQVEPLGNRYSGVRQAEELFHAVVEHHRAAQAAKPPDGKRPWVESVRDGIVVRPAYKLPARPEPAATFVHDYRSRSVSSFLKDLRRLTA